MIGRIARSLVVVAGMAATVVSLPAESKACWLFGCAPRTTYRPIWGANYATYYGGSSCGTGCCSSGCAPTTTYYAPVTTYYAPSGCSTCGSSCGSACGTCNTCNYQTYRPACTTGCYAPVTVRYAPAPVASCCTPTSATLSSGMTYLPNASVSTDAILPSSSAPTSTYAPGPVVQENALKPAPDPKTNGSSTNTLPRASEDEGRTTMLPRYEGLNVRTAVYSAEVGARVVPVSAEAPAKTFDDGGWTASKR